MKRSVKMIALLVVLALLAGGTSVVQKLSAPETVSEEKGTFMLTQKTGDAVAALAWTYEETDYRFVKQDGVWKKADDEAYPADGEKLQQMADGLAALEASIKLEDVEQLSDYGLADPAFSVTAEWTDGTSSTFARGAKLPFDEGYYLYVSDDASTVYGSAQTPDSLFTKGATDLAVLENLPRVEDPVRLVAGSVLDASLVEKSSTVNSLQLWYTADGKPLKDSSMESLAADAAEMAWGELVSPNASAEELSVWELTDDKAFVITLYGKENSRTVLIGAADDSGNNYYARLPESSMVYTVAYASVSELLKADAAALRVTDLMPLAYDSVAQATVEAAGMSVTFSGIPAEETAAETAETPEKELWALVKALKADAFVQDAPKGDALLTVSAANAEGVSQTLTFYEYDADSYLVVCGSDAALTDAAEVDRIIRTLRQLV